MLQASTPAVTLTAIPTAYPQQLADTIGHGAAKSTQEELNPGELQQVIGDRRLAMSALQYHYGNQPDLPPSTSHAITPIIIPPPTNQHKCKRKNGRPRKKRKDRECTHCHSKHCEGCWGVKKCDAWQAARMLTTSGPSGE